MLSSELEFCLNEAFQNARDNRHEFMTVEHLLLALLDIPKVHEILKACDTHDLGIFGMERPKATRVMLEVHTKGKGICGVYDYQIAETKVAQVMGIAQQQQHPLLCTMEES